MNKKHIVLITLLLITMLMSYSFADAEVSDITIELDMQDEYTIGEAITGGATLSQGGTPVANAQVSYKLTDAEETQLLNIGQLKVDVNGHVELDIMYPDNVAVGNYRITFAFENYKVSDDFIIVEAKLTAELNKTYLKIDERIDVKGKVNDDVSDSVQIKVTDKAGTALYNVEQVSLENKQYEYSFLMPDYAPKGEYKVIITPD